jgi:hypothetical protein
MFPCLEYNSVSINVKFKSLGTIQTNQKAETSTLEFDGLTTAAL